MLPVIKKGKKVMILIVSKEEMQEIAKRLSGRTFEEKINIPVIETEAVPKVIDMNHEEAYMRPVIEARANTHTRHQTKPTTHIRRNAHKSVGIIGVLKDRYSAWKAEQEYIREYEDDGDTTLKVVARVIKKIATGDIYDTEEYPNIPYDPVRDVIYLNGYKED